MAHYNNLVSTLVQETADQQESLKHNLQYTKMNLKKI